MKGLMKKTINEREIIENNLDLNRTSDGVLLVRLRGIWKIVHPLPSADVVEKQLTTGPHVERVSFDTSELTDWDSGLLTFLMNVKEFCSQNKIRIETDGLPEGAR